MSCVAIIPARGGSKRIPRKNIRDFLGKPIIAYSIEAARNSNLFDRIIVSTDDPEIASFAAARASDVVMRPPHLSLDDVGTQEVTAWTLHELGISDGYACCIYATAPLLHTADLRLGHGVTMGRNAFFYSVHGWRDAGQFYFGSVDAFASAVPLDHWSTAHVEVGSQRFCDINTEADWLRAEQMYARLQALA